MRSARSTDGRLRGEDVELHGGAGVFAPESPLGNAKQQSGFVTDCPETWRIWFDPEPVDERVRSLALMFEREESGDPAEIVERRGLKQVTDTGAIEKIVDEIIAANPEQVAQVREKPKTMGWFVGQVMKASQGKANPQAVNEILKSKLGVE